MLKRNTTEKYEGIWNLNHLWLWEKKIFVKIWHLTFGWVEFQGEKKKENVT